MVPEQNAAGRAGGAFDLARPLDAAAAAFRRGDFAGVLEILDRLPIPSTGPQRGAYVEYRARALLRMNEPDAALELLEDTAETIDEVDGAATALMLLGSALARVRDPAKGLAVLDEAAAFASRADVDRAIRAEIDYYRAVTLRVLDLHAQAAQVAADAVAANCGLVSARAEALRGWLASDGDQWPLALERFRSAHEMLIAQGSAGDVHLAAMVESEISQIELHLRSRALAGHHHERFDASRSTAFFPVTSAPIQRFQILFHDALSFAIDGEATRSVELAWRAQRFADEAGGAWGIVGDAGRASITRLVGEPMSGTQLLLAAAERAERIDWTHELGPDRVALIFLAEEMATVDSERAASFLVAHRRSARPEFANVKRSRRDLAHEAFVEARIDRQLGKTLDAVEKFRFAYRAFKEIGFLWRATLALIELDRTPWHAGTHHAWALETAALIVREHFPRSFLVRMMGQWAHVFEDEVGKTLRPYQREVLRDLVAGRSPKEIASQTGREYHTVRGYVGELHKAFAVRSTRELILEAVRRGIA